MLASYGYKIGRQLSRLIVKNRSNDGKTFGTRGKDIGS